MLGVLNVRKTSASLAEKSHIISGRHANNTKKIKRLRNADSVELYSRAPDIATVEKKSAQSRRGIVAINSRIAAMLAMAITMNMFTLLAFMRIVLQRMNKRHLE